MAAAERLHRAGVPASLADYGLTPGAQLRVQSPVLAPPPGLPTPSHVFLIGGFFP
jgi:hypothetical protein